MPRNRLSARPPGLGRAPHSLITTGTFDMHTRYSTPGLPEPSLVLVPAFGRKNPWRQRADSHSLEPEFVMAEIAQQSHSRLAVRPSPWSELFRKEDWWAIWIGL